ncbi:lipid droplet-associated protein [Hoyosella rhizosphaerae]|uniref:Lipid droplet-associated protein n=1 Tax=Hoyosella rhizosphaerae TaxID=1755582 RepID=A0A916UDF7_9ACTN|nr:lipid droplet-associated protein [Hoyosella rhizosphaerae]MBN4925653.1 lipid droplet-associated protein [Hoyosella rhizosphaerae]GGC68957.1 hypothetical protein GCM10011410_22220 [Hoyosella rhizosphaerae]
MRRPPFAARVAAGLALTVVEETRRLPTTAATFPMTAISQVLQTSMRLQQKVTELAIKGDQAFEWLYPPQDEPTWVTFDEDREPVQTLERSGSQSAPKAVAAGASSSSPNGRFALYSAPVVNPANSPVSAPQEAAESQAASVDPADVATPKVAERVNYDTLTLAQLRARLRQFSVEDLADLLQYEEQKFRRAPFQTMLANRITTVMK